MSRIKHFKDDDGNWQTVEIPFTAEEQTAHDAKTAQADAQAEMNNWQREMNRTDGYLSRFEEDTMDIVGVENYPQEWQDKHASKKAKRAEKPA